MAADIVERLAPRWATDEEISRAAARRDNAMREIVTDFLVANNALKAEAKAEIEALRARVGELETNYQLAHQRAADAVRAGIALEAKADALAKARVTVLEAALTEIATIEPVALSEMDEVSGSFAKLNRAVRAARSALKEHQS